MVRRPAPREQRARGGIAARVRELPRAHPAQRRPGRRHAVRRRRRDGAARGRDGQRAARPLRRRPGRAARAPARDRADARRAAARRAARRASWRPSRRSRCCAGATRASTSASSSTSRATRSRSAATCSPAASWRRWSSATPCCASCPARSGTSDSAVEESFSAGARAAPPSIPHYTRPAEYRGWRVPEVLLSGHHERIERLAARAEPRARRGRAEGREPESGAAR